MGHIEPEVKSPVESIKSRLSWVLTSVTLIFMATVRELWVARMKGKKNG